MLGIWGTSVVHLAKGIESFALKNKKYLLYAIGLLMDASSVLWLTIANLYGPPSYYTSMYGFGLIVLLLYSKFRLNEKISKEIWFSAALLIAGTGILGISGVLTTQPSFTGINSSRLYLGSAILGGILLFLLILSLKFGDKTFLGISFGIIAGTAASLEPIYRALGQSMGADDISLFPTTIEGWFIFGASFMGGILGLIFTQLAFAKGAKATTVIPSFNSVYVVLPQFMLLFCLPSYRISFMMIVGLIFTLLGILLLDLFKLKNREKNPGVRNLSQSEGSL